jgi:hypothetical protein
MSLLTVKMVGIELEDMMATGTIGETLSVCGWEKLVFYHASNVGWVKWTGVRVRLAGHVALMARTYVKVLV